MERLARLAELVVGYLLEALPWVGLLICMLLLIVWRGNLKNQRLSKIGLYATFPIVFFIGIFLAVLMKNQPVVSVLLGLLSFALYYAPLAVLTVIFLLSAGFALKPSPSVGATTWRWSGHLVLALIAATYVLLFLSFRLPVPESCAEIPLGC